MWAFSLCALFCQVVPKSVCVSPGDVLMAAGISKAFQIHRQETAQLQLTCSIAGVILDPIEHDRSP